MDLSAIFLHFSKEKDFLPLSITQRIKNRKQTKTEKIIWQKSDCVKKESKLYVGKLIYNLFYFAHRRSEGF